MVDRRDLEDAVPFAEGSRNPGFRAGVRLRFRPAFNPRCFLQSSGSIAFYGIFGATVI